MHSLFEQQIPTPIYRSIKSRKRLHFVYIDFSCSSHGACDHQMLCPDSTNAQVGQSFCFPHSRLVPFNVSRLGLLIFHLN